MIAIYEAGSCQEMSLGLIGSPIYSSFHVVEFELCKYVVSFNGATRLIQGHEFFHSGFLRAQRHFQSFQTFSLPIRDLTSFREAANRFPPGPHFRDYCGRGPAKI
jgi:hypothetical protein